MGNQKWFLLTVAFLTCILPGPSQAATAITGITQIQTYNGHEYAYANTRSTWTDANAYTADGWHLVIINDAAENAWLSMHYQDYSWIGLYCPDGVFNTMSEWQWIDGSIPSYSNWQANQPDLNDAYAALGYGWEGLDATKWGNVPNDGKVPWAGVAYSPVGLFERVESVTPPPPSTVPEPTTLFLLGVGMIGLAGYGRKKLN